MFFLSSRKSIESFVLWIKKIWKKRRLYEFISIESSENICMDLNNVVAIKPFILENKGNNTHWSGVQIFTNFGIIFNVKGTYDQTLKLVWGIKK